jgi:hypothetical protein
MPQSSEVTLPLLADIPVSIKEDFRYIYMMISYGLGKEWTAL